MQITTATRTVEIYANTAAYVTYRNVKDGAAYGPVRTAKADAKAGSVGREVFDAAQAPAEVEVAEVAETETVTEIAAPVATQTETVTEIAEGAEITVQGRKGRVTEVFYANPGYRSRSWAGVLWETTEGGARRQSHGFVYLDQLVQA